MKIPYSYGILCIWLVTSGCNFLTKKPSNPIPQVFNGQPTLQEVVQFLNTNASRVQFLELRMMLFDVVCEGVDGDGSMASWTRSLSGFVEACEEVGTVEVRLSEPLVEV